MKYADIIDFYGSGAAAAEAVGVSRQTVHRWKRIPRIPTDPQLRYELLTRGALRADLPPKIRRGRN
jgi:hypothetical protein